MDTGSAKTKEEEETQAAARPVNPGLKHSGLRAALEFGPVVAFLISYLIYRDATVTVAGTAYSGLVAVTAGFLPVFALATGALWALTGRIARLQVAVTVLAAIFGALGVAMNDPTLFKMKPTVIYLALALFLWAGLRRGQSWLKLIVDQIVPLEHRGWMILTRRVMRLSFGAALANELVWRTQSETFWVYFETLAMPGIVLVFVIAQVPLYIEYAKGHGSRRRGRGQRRGRKAQRQG